MSETMMVNNMIRKIMMELRRLEITYGYMMANAPTEEARRLVQVNTEVVKHTMEMLGHMYQEINGMNMPPLSEAALDVPVFTDFNEAARYAFLQETQVIRMLRDYYIINEECYSDRIFGAIVDHQLNAMRMLYLI